jgi:hypothetical protein
LEKIEEVEKDMTPKLIEDLGMKYPTEKSNYKARFGLYECQYCGKEFECAMQSVKTGSTKSCGCLRGVKSIHGMCSNKFYKTWYGMLQRCDNLESINYKYYGARGIVVCEEWQDVTNFVAWAESTHPNREGVSLDRIDNDKGYSPENCTWSDKTTQAINQRIMKNNKSGYVGIYYYKKYNTWRANIRINKILKQIGTFKTLEEAVQARDNYIIENNLPHKLSTGYE